MLEISKLVLIFMPLVAWIAGIIAAKSDKKVIQLGLAVLVILVSCTAGGIQIAMT